MMENELMTGTNVSGESTPLKKKKTRKINDHSPADKVSADIGAHIGALAKLSDAEYERTRKREAKRLGVRLEFLDKKVKESRQQLENEEDAPIFGKPVGPWLEPVNGDELLRELLEVLTRHLVLKDALAVPLWVLFAHSHDAWQNSPILLIASPTKRCGKTNLMKLLTKLVPQPLPTSNATGASIFHAVDLYKPTLLIDEADTWKSLTGETRGILNSGHDRAGAGVLRVKRMFSTWAPKAIALIGGLPATLEDRSIKIEMRRKLPRERVEKVPHDIHAYHDLCRKCARWAKDNLEALRAASPAMPRLNDRASDNWWPLLAIAEACGGDWPATAQKAARRISRSQDDEDPAVLLLQDIRELFERKRADQVSGDMIVDHLAQLEHRLWGHYHQGGPITKHGVAKLLKPFGIRPVQVSVGRRRPNGYRLEQFRLAWRQYLPKAAKKRPGAKSPPSRKPAELAQ
jgi:putative DNA primase/helicase